MRHTPSLVASTLLAAGVGMALGLAAPAAAAPRTAVVSVLHAIPGAGPVDVYADGELVVDALPAGRMATMRLPSGRFDLAFHADGTTPADGAPVVRSRGSLTPGGDVTVAAHLSPAGTPTATAFANDTRTVGMGMGRLTVRNLAAAGPIQVRVDGAQRRQLGEATAGRQATSGLRAGTYRVALASPEGNRLADPVRVTLVNAPGRQDMGTNTIVYAWGSDGQLRTSVQEVRLDLR